MKITTECSDYVGSRGSAHSQSLIKATSYGFIVAFLAFFFGAYLRSSRSVPFQDDWTYVHVLELDPLGKARWLIAQHVDHRIPIQKAIQYAVLKLSDFDFRYLVGLNMLLCAILSAMYLEIARMVRSSRSIGDMLVPLLVLGPASGPSLWGFQFQFLSSVFMLTAATLSTIIYIKTRRISWLWAAISICAISALCGVNGLFTSTAFLLGLAAIHWIMGSELPPVSRSVRWGWSGAVTFCLVLWLAWRPSSNSNVSLDLNLFTAYGFGMYGSPFGIYSFIGEVWKASLVLIMAATALGTSCWLILRRRADPAVIVVVLTVVASCLLGLAVAVGREKTQGGWNPVNGMHYSFLMIPVLLGAWIILSSYMREGIRMIVALCFLYMGCAAYLTNAKWRFEHVDSVAATRAILSENLRDGIPSSDIAKKYIAEMTNDKAQMLEIQHGIDLLRHCGYRNYGGRPGPS